MKSKRSRLALVGVLALAVSVTVGLTVSGTAAAKKKKKAGGTVDITKAVNQQVPDATATTNGVLVSTIDVGGKKFKGTKVRDVNVTLQATGSAGDAADDLTVRLTAPNGATTWLFGNELVGQSFGPLTFDDESVNTIGFDTPSRDSTLLAPPYAGTVQPHCFSAQAGCTLSAMDNGPVSGTWTLRVVDNDSAPALTSILNSWRLTAVAGKAFLT